MPDYMNIGNNKCNDYDGIGKDFSCLANHKEPKYLIVGDSHALSLYNGVVNSTEKMMLIAGHGCLMLPGVKTYNSYNLQDTKNCEYIDDYVKYVRNKNKSIDTLIIVMRNNFYFKKSLNNTGYYFINKYKKDESDIVQYADSLSKFINLNSDINIYFVLDWPEINKFPIFCIYNKCSIPYEKHLRNSLTLKNIVENIQEKHNNLKIISVDDSFCDLFECSIKDDYNILQFDYDHLSTYGSIVVLKSIINKIERLN